MHSDKKPHIIIDFTTFSSLTSELPVRNVQWSKQQQVQLLNVQLVDPAVVVRNKRADDRRTCPVRCFVLELSGSIRFTLIGLEAMEAMRLLDNWGKVTVTVRDQTVDETTPNLREQAVRFSRSIKEFRRWNSPTFVFVLWLFSDLLLEARSRLSPLSTTSQVCHRSKYDDTAAVFCYPEGREHHMCILPLLHNILGRQTTRGDVALLLTLPGSLWFLTPHCRRGVCAKMTKKAGICGFWLQCVFSC